VPPSTAAPTTPDLRGSLRALSVGGVGVLHAGAREIVTGYRKDPVAGRLRLGRLGLPGDAHVYEHHGGPDKAICVYSLEHYRHWEQTLGLTLPEAAAFGENFTVTGLVEADVELGDVFAVGDAVVQVTQPRAPCYKIAARYGVKEMAVLVQRAGFTGYLLRVLTEGAVGAGDELRLLTRAGTGVTVAEANRVLNVDKGDLAGARRVLAVPGLPDSVTAPLQRRLRERGSAEDLDRLYGEE
jgi:MOSC domain-containing protein YiiM